ncbi:6-bladed beta-propeller [uncultured Bacteroides sp.]|uniref:6-bladed beta-propeller n=1 Tax=uncultured Bacteroides sp. TaxID=162156 RepID=UPI002AAAC1F1|nr:6-bladed beta-propeller [uncultured Bacteroides sp.]
MNEIIRNRGLNNYIKNVLFLFFLSSLCSCANKENTPKNLIKTVNIDASKVEPLEYNDYFKKATLIALETLPESLIGEVSKLYMTDSLIVIFDKKQMAIMLFDIKGNFIRQIGKKGSAPDEYTFFNDIQFERETSLIYAHERYKIFW